MCIQGAWRLNRNTTPRGFEPLRAEPNGFQVHLLNRSDTLSWVLAFGKQISLKESLSTNPSKAGKKTCFSNNRFHWCGKRNNAHAGGRAWVTSMGGLYDAATLRAPMQHGQKRISSAPRQYLFERALVPNLREAQV